MLLVKCLSLLDYISEAREVLLHIKGLLEAFISDKKIDYNKI